AGPAALHGPPRCPIRGTAFGFLCRIDVVRKPRPSSAPERERRPAVAVAPPEAASRLCPAPDAHAGGAGMSEELFERYLRNDLDEAGARELSAILVTEEGTRAFTEFVQEWTLLGEAARQRVAETGRPAKLRNRKRVSASKPGLASVGWGAGLAAAVLFMIALATPTRMPAPAPVAKFEPPAPAPAEP